MGDNMSSLAEDGMGGVVAIVVGGVVVCALTVGIGKRLYRRQYRAMRLSGETDRSTLTQPDLIYLLMPPRIGVISNISPFAIKLETWFRLIDVPYQVVETTLPSSKHQFPYIILNGIETPDTRFIVERVAKHFNKEVDPNLSDEERAVSVAISRMLEENTLFTYAWYRILFQSAEFWGLFSADNKGVLAKKMLKFAPPLMKQSAKVKFWQQGVSRHKPAEIYSLAETDLKALSDYLGTKDYFFGKEPTLVDCVAFGHLVQILWLRLNFPPRFYAVKECKNLLGFLDRMRDRLYPDWEELCNPSAS